MPEMESSKEERAKFFDAFYEGPMEVALEMIDEWHDRAIEIAERLEKEEKAAKEAEEEAEIAEDAHQSTPQ